MHRWYFCILAEICDFVKASHSHLKIIQTPFLPKKANLFYRFATISTCIIPAPENKGYDSLSITSFWPRVTLSHEPENTLPLHYMSPGLLIPRSEVTRRLYFVKCISYNHLSLVAQWTSNHEPHRDGEYKIIHRPGKGQAWRNDV